LVEGTVEILLLGLGLALAAVYAMGIGANDTANSIAGPVGGGVLKYRSASTSVFY